MREVQLSGLTRGEGGTAIRAHAGYSGQTRERTDSNQQIGKRQTDRHTNRHRQTETDTATEKQRDTETDRQRQKQRQRGRQRQTEPETDRQTERTNERRTNGLLNMSNREVGVGDIYAHKQS